MTIRTEAVEAVVGVCEALLRDLSTVGLAPRLSVFDLTSRSWVVAGERVPDGFGSEGLVVQTPTSDHLVDLTADLASELAGIASLVQDWAIEELWTGWPVASGTGPLLAPVGVDDGVVWMNGRRVVARVGSLAEGAT